MHTLQQTFAEKLIKLSTHHHHVGVTCQVEKLGKCSLKLGYNIIAFFYLMQLHLMSPVSSIDFSMLY